MSREFLINLIFLLIINAIIKPLYIFGIDRTIQNTVGEDYGIYFTLLSFTYLFQMLNDFGIQNFNARNISMNPVLLNRYLPGIIQIKLGLALIFSFFVFLSAYLIGYKGFYIEILWWLVIIQILSSFLLYMRSNIAGLGHYRVDSFLSILDKLLLILICGFLLLNESTSSVFQIQWFLYAQVFALSVSILFTFYFVLGKIKVKFLSFHLPMIRITLKQSYPFALIYVLMMVYTRIDAVMLERLLDDGVQEAYVYASAYRLLDAANMISYLFVGLLLPMFSRMLGRKEGIQPLFQTSVKLMAISTAVVALPVFFFNQDIMELLYTSGNAYSGRVLQLLFLGHIMISFGHIFGALMIANGTIRDLNKIYLTGILVNLSLNFLLIPQMKAEGAAYSTVVTEVLVLGGLVYLIFVHFKKIWTWRLIAKISAFGFLCGFALFTFKATIEIDWRIGYFISIGICGILAVVLRLIPSKELLQVLQFNQKIKQGNHDALDQ